jgi:hypothetical protein
MVDEVLRDDNAAVEGTLDDSIVLRDSDREVNNEADEEADEDEDEDSEVEIDARPEAVNTGEQRPKLG